MTQSKLPNHKEMVIFIHDGKTYYGQFTSKKTKHPSQFSNVFTSYNIEEDTQKFKADTVTDWTSFDGIHKLIGDSLENMRSLKYQLDSAHAAAKNTYLENQKLHSEINFHKHALLDLRNQYEEDKKRDRGFFRLFRRW